MATPDTVREMKIEAARAALAEVRSGMKLGLGTGSTAREFVELLGQSIRSGVLTGIRAVCTSRQTESQAHSLGIPLQPLSDLGPLDLSVDGTDEIDPALRLIKGLGGALLREKIVEQASTRFIVIADHTKLVEKLGRGWLPVEVVTFACDLLESRFREMKLEPRRRELHGKPLTTDEGHQILDIRVPATSEIAEIVESVRRCAGVVETGFFPWEATEAIIAMPDGIERRSRTRPEVR